MKSGAGGSAISLMLSFPLAGLLVGCSVTGLLYPGIYSTATPNWLAQTVGQDAIDLFLITPVLVVSAVYAYYGNRLARVMWGGTIAYIIYTFLIYCFCVSFNALFAAYCAVLGLSVFSWISFLYHMPRVGVHISDDWFLKSSAIYFILISIVFSILWLAEIIPASLAGHVPDSVLQAGIPTNPVHVIDLSMFLPAMFMLGLMVWRRKSWAFYLIPVALVFLILMDLTIAALAAILMQQGQPGDSTVVFVMGAMALVNVGLLIWFLNVSAEDLSH
ncbi:MAG TPA: hypothetical protein VG737_03870 [Cyclobacteriaceae bacterium]|nr:hypothetical protein [Cyclobacteriaceae bacterium]